MKELPEHSPQNQEFDEQMREWIDSFNYVVAHEGPQRAAQILERLRAGAVKTCVPVSLTLNTPYINTISRTCQPSFPGNLAMEQRIENIVRWNAMAMVMRANKAQNGIGGHIATYASAATLFEVGFNHFFRAPQGQFPGDMVFFQGHASPGVYARAFVEGRLSHAQIDNFRRELQPAGGLSSYPHPYLMPDFWQFSTVSMGLTSLLAIYQARFLRYLEARGIKPNDDARVWALMGDGECDEPESLGAIAVASREHLDNLVFVVNCNLQRLDGPVRGNGKIIQDLETVFRGAQWNVIKVIWAGEWDELLERDRDGLLVERMNQVVDGQFQKYSTESGDFFRRDFFGVDERLLKLVSHLSDDQLHALRRGGHDIQKVYAAFQSAVGYRNGPTVILCHTIKGYGMGDSGEGMNIAHKEKKLSGADLKSFRTRFAIPFSDEQLADIPLYKPEEHSPEMTYLKERRAALGGAVPQRAVRGEPLAVPGPEFFAEFYQGSGGRPVSSTMAYVRMLAGLMQHRTIGKYIVPIVPDEARTFGMDALFRPFGIYSQSGQRYTPVDRQNIMYYREVTNGQILEEGISEAGAMASFIAAGTAYATAGVNTIPFYTYYSMFGFQRIGDMIWAAADMLCRGFLIGATSGRTTLNGEGLQHQDGHSHLLFSVVPGCVAYDPAFAYELAVIIRDGMRRMCEQQQPLLYYLTVTNESYPMPEMPEGSEDGILRGIYKFRTAERRLPAHVQLWGSGALMQQVLVAQQMLAERFEVSSDVWSVTSYTELRRQAVEIERWNMLHPLEPPRVPYITGLFAAQADIPVVAVSDYLKTLPDSIAKWVPGRLCSLGTDGFGRSESRQALRDFFEVDARYICYAALGALAAQGGVSAETVRAAAEILTINPEKPNPLYS